MNVGVIGAGSWGTALANLLAKNGHEVTLWAYEQDLVARMQQRKENDLYLPGFTLDSRLTYVTVLSEAVRGRDMLLLVSPSQLLRNVLQQAEPYIAQNTLLVLASKGVENDTLMLMSEVVEDVLPAEKRQRVAFLSGPTFAREVAEELPSAAAIASESTEVAHLVQKQFSCDYFRPYCQEDVIGVELGGALKNVIALAAGVCDGLGFGSNTRAALITRGLEEMTRIGLAKGAKRATFSGLAGMGDLALTCTGDLSRNRSVGIELGRGRKIQDILADMQMVAEGVKTTTSAYQLAQKLGVEAPIIEQMYLILNEDKDPREAVRELMQRQLKSEPS